MLIYLIKGGPLMIAIGLCSIAAGALAIVQWLRLLEMSDHTSKHVVEIAQAIQKRDWASAVQISDQYDHPFLKPWRAGFILLIEGKSDLRDIEETVSIEGTKMIAQLESALRQLGALTAILPMLGFLGTILGLIISFEAWEQMGAQVSISALAGGIYQAMITTAAGLIAAIPYNMLYHYFTAQAQKVALEFSKETTQLFRLVKDTLLRETPVGPDPVLSTTP